MKKKDLLKGIKAVLFDMDGTLVDSMWMWPQIDKEFLNSRGFEVPADLKDDIDGLSMWDDAIYFKKRFGFKDSEQELIDSWNQMALHHYENDTPLKPGAKEFLEYLKSKKTKRGLVTSNSLVLCEASLKANGVYDDFDTFVTSEDVKHGKPDPEGYLIAARELGVDPSECLVTEDLPAGITAARRAGMKVVSIEDDYSKRVEEEKKQMSDAFISDYRELIR
ncbi:MAG: HAD family phosphatase [Lachnospiraceae bacterium]|nr:HAD family phosphatase [Lachnospiraceae bacterium]